MTTLAAIEAQLDAWEATPPPRAAAGDMLRLAEAALECWLTAHGKAPTDDVREGFRLLALHRQGAQGDPSFNACRETCREAAYRYNLAVSDCLEAEAVRHLAAMRRLVQHLALFIAGKLQTAGLGEFCCASRPLREAGG
jgi:hypothetical protein